MMCDIDIVPILTPTVGKATDSIGVHLRCYIDETQNLIQKHRSIVRYKPFTFMIQLKRNCHVLFLYTPCQSQESKNTIATLLCS